MTTKTPTRCINCARHGMLGFPHPCTEPYTEACRHCPWPGCVCTHGAGCDRGWLDSEPLAPGYDPSVRRCPTCAAAAKDAALLIAAGR